MDWEELFFIVKIITRTFFGVLLFFILLDVDVSERRISFREEKTLALQRCNIKNLNPYSYDALSLYIASKNYPVSKEEEYFSYEDFVYFVKKFNPELSEDDIACLAARNVPAKNVFENK